MRFRSIFVSSVVLFLGLTAVRHAGGAIAADDISATVAVTIVDPERHQPIPGAAVSRLFTDGTPPLLVGKADTSGVVRLKIDPSERTGLLATAEGAGPTTFGFWGCVPTKQTITMARLARFGGRLLDAQGRPSAGIPIHAQWTAGMLLIPVKFWSMKQFTFDIETKTDAEGRFWFDGRAEGSDLELNFIRAESGAAVGPIMGGSPAFVALRHGQFELKANSIANKPFALGYDAKTFAAHVQPLRIRLKVVDADTGRPIAPSYVCPGGQMSPEQSPYVMQGRGLELESSEIVWRFAEDGYAFYFRVHADGYADASTRLVKTSERDVDVELRLAPVLKRDFVLLTPDGKPAAGARGYLSTPTKPLNALNVDASPELERWRTPIDFIADTRGVLTVNQPADRYRVAILHDEGWAEIDPAALKKGEPVQLNLWGSATIQVCSGSHLRANAPLAGGWVQAGFGQSNESDCFINWISNVTADAEGNAQLKHVRPGNFGFTVIQAYEVPRGSTWNSVHAQMAVDERETTTMRVMDGPHSIKATVTELPGYEWGSVSIAAVGRPTTLPAGLDRLRAADAQSAVEKAVSSAGPDDGVIRPDISIRVGADGSIAADGLAPGTYHFSAYAAAPRGTQASSLSIDRYFVLAGTEPSTLNLGVLSPDTDFAKIAIGQPAPKMHANTADGKPFKLSDYKGHWVLLDFWGTWCGFCIRQEPVLKDAFDGWGRDGRLTLVGVSIEDTTQQVIDHCAKHELPWTQVVLGDREHTDIPQRFGVSGYPTLLLIDPNGDLASEGLSSMRVREILMEKLGPAALIANP